LSAGQRDKLFRAWFDCQSVLEVARKCRVSPVTCKKYMKKDGWRKRRDEILVKAQKSGDDRQAFKLTSELNALHVFIQHHIKRLAELLKKNEIEPTIPNLLHLIEGKRELLKEVEIDVPTAPESDKVADILNLLTEDTAKMLVAAAVAELKKENGGGKT